MENPIGNEQSQVLVADDDPAILKMVKTVLEKEGYEVLMCRDGREVYKLLSSSTRFAAAIFDVKMPHIEGTELLKYMRADKRLINIPVIIMTAEENSRILQEIYQAGAVAFLPKPFAVSHLQTLLRTFAAKT
jgi:type IV pili sensor histidine kinase/response regulator